MRICQRIEYNEELRLKNIAVKDQLDAVLSEFPRQLLIPLQEVYTNWQEMDQLPQVVEEVAKKHKLPDEAKVLLKAVIHLVCYHRLVELSLDVIKRIEKRK